jgi:hypothetical protein
MLRERADLSFLNRCDFPFQIDTVHRLFTRGLEMHLLNSGTTWVTPLRETKCIEATCIPLEPSKRQGHGVSVKKSERQEQSNSSKNIDLSYFSPLPCLMNYSDAGSLSLLIRLDFFFWKRWDLHDSRSPVDGWLSPRSTGSASMQRLAAGIVEMVSFLVTQSAHESTALSGAGSEASFRQIASCSETEEAMPR